MDLDRCSSSFSSTKNFRQQTSLARFLRLRFDIAQSVMKKSKNRAALRPLKLLIYPIGILPVASRHSENLRRRLGNVFQFRTAATDHNSSSELLRLKIIAETALDDLKNLFGARRRDPVDRQTRN